MKRLSILFIALLMSGIYYSADAQINRKKIRKNNKRISTFKGKKTFFAKEKRYNWLAISLNTFNYFGDLAPLNKTASTDISFTSPAIGVMFGHRFGPFYTLRASFTYGTLKGEDAASADPNDPNAVSRYVRNLSFRNRIKELTVVGVFDLFKNESTYISRVQWTPYAFTGLTVFHHNPQAQAPEFDLSGNPLPEAGEWVDLQPLGTEGQYADLQDGDANTGIEPYSKIQIAIPLGIGIRYRLNQVFDLSLETSFRFLFTDYIDDVSQNYVDLGVFDNELAKAMSYRSGELVGNESNDNAAAILGRRTTYSGRDGQSYTVVNGYGAEDIGNLRGSRDQNDMYFVTTIKMAYIIGATFRRAKFR
ncbi:MAG: DUF6089 family protein [Fulvivirga sp.]